MLNLALAQEIAGHGASFGNTWCYPSQQTLLRKMRQYHGQVISLRTINRHLATLVAAGWLRRQRRHQHDEHGKWTFRSTCYIVLRPCQRALASLVKTAAYFLRFSRVPSVANSETPTGYNSQAGVPAGPPATAKREPPPNWAASTRKLLAR